MSFKSILSAVALSWATIATNVQAEPPIKKYGPNAIAFCHAVAAKSWVILNCDAPKFILPWPYAGYLKGEEWKEVYDIWYQFQTADGWIKLTANIVWQISDWPNQGAKFVPRANSLDEGIKSVTRIPSFTQWSGPYSAK
jgi:hypothetical protein